MDLVDPDSDSDPEHWFLETAIICRGPQKVVLSAAESDKNIFYKLFQRPSQYYLKKCFKIHKRGGKRSCRGCQSVFRESSVEAFKML